MPEKSLAADAAIACFSSALISRLNSQRAPGASREIYSLDTITLLLEKGADRSLKDLEGKTAADVARESEKAELAKLLDNRHNGTVREQ
jgi:hypothetical protein